MDIDHFGLNIKEAIRIKRLLHSLSKNLKDEVKFFPLLHNVSTG